MKRKHVPALSALIVLFPTLARDRDWNRTEKSSRWRGPVASTRGRVRSPAGDSSRGQADATARVPPIREIRGYFPVSKRYIPEGSKRSVRSAQDDSKMGALRGRADAPHPFSHFRYRLICLFSRRAKDDEGVGQTQS